MKVHVRETYRPVPPPPSLEETAHRDISGAQRGLTTSFERSLPPQEHQYPTRTLPPIQPSGSPYPQAQVEVPSSSHSELARYATNVPTSSHYYTPPISQSTRASALPSLSTFQGEAHLGQHIHDPRYHVARQPSVPQRQIRGLPHQYTSRPISQYQRSMQQPQQPMQQPTLGWFEQTNTAPSSEYDIIRQYQMGEWSTARQEPALHDNRHTSSHRTYLLYWAISD
ncbi:hypothetical protein BDW22DRAFT_943003 [Trametopsis cervina]|nr:hypothetical protein BDW22DRAFT_943003 [Trametopsis cervina]